VVIDGDDAWLETTLLRADWEFQPGVMSGSWVTSTPIRQLGRPRDDSPAQRLSTEGLRFVHSSPDEVRRKWELPPGSFAAERGRVFLKLDPGQEPPDRATLAVYAGRRGRAGERQRIAGGRFSGDGFSIWSGEGVELTVDLPPASSLRFATALEPALSKQGHRRQPVLFRVTLDGEPVFEHEETDPAVTRLAWHEIALPAEGRSGSRIRFEIGGALAYSSFLAPVIGPAEVDRREEPAAGRRRNIVLFLADTFRADNMRAYGGELDLTPYLDRIAEQGLLFRRSWSVGTRTLPAHASMFSGLYPLQVGVVTESRALPGGVVTIAELLSRNGYRTGAITGSVVVSRRFALDRGFEWFDERQGGLESTLARVRTFLDADDGRPIFLFVQTYRTHTPYHVSETTRRERGEALGIEGEFWEVEREWSQLQKMKQPGPRDLARRGRAADRLRGLYRGAVVDLDRGFRTFHRELLTRGLLEDGYLLFTSDHGEAFLEHGVLYHTGKVWEEQSRIPLIITGPGLPVGAVEHAASLVDLPPTLAEMAGIAPDEAWLGRSLISLDGDRPVYVFESRKKARSTLALIEGEHKVIGFESPAALRSGRLFGAFDLTSDPQERANLATSPADWPRKLIRRLGPTAAELLDPVVVPEAAELDPAKLEQLRALGYLQD
jgi:arylsulfatase